MQVVFVSSYLGSSPPILSSLPLPLPEPHLRLQLSASLRSYLPASLHPRRPSPLSVRTCSRASGDEAPKCLIPDGLVVRTEWAGLLVLVHRLQQLQRNVT
ncbi:hypothetical protein AMECASPLE_029618 [Ameca splendens]|uniref:Uncharacterized protein n=1 Tax=Ameca splendens TaxID=208324 RepID=A0ABV0ZQP8_9TELE